MAKGMRSFINKLRKVAGSLYRDASDRLKGRQRLHFIHIGKTGGTAIRTALLGVYNDEYRFVLHSHDFTLLDLPQGDSAFFFVRDPLTRYVSGFYNTYRKGRPAYFQEWTEQIRVTFDRFPTPNALGLGLGSSDIEERLAAEAGMRCIGHVKDSYWRWFGSREQLCSRVDDIFFVGAQERLEADFSHLLQLLHFGNISLPLEGKKAHRSPGGEDKSLSDDAKRNLREWYAKDYEFLSLLRERFPNLPSYEMEV